MSYKIAIVSSEKSWINPHIEYLMFLLKQEGHSVQHLFDVKDIPSGDFAFYLNCWQIADKNILSRNKHNLVVHPSGLPQGRGWAPLSWQILEGSNKIPITLFEAEEKVDRGPIYLQEFLHFRGDEMVDDLRKQQGEMSVWLCLEFVKKYPLPVQNQIEQKGEASYYPKRSPKDSELDVNKTIAEQFDLLRIADNDSYPAHFNFRGHTYILKISKSQL